MKPIKSLSHILFSCLAMFGFGCNSGTATKTPEEISNPPSTWGDDLTYSYLDDDEPDGKQAMKLAKKHGGYENYYARFKVGNLAIIEGSTPPPPFVMDADGQSGYIAVITGKTPSFITLPNKKLFAHYMELIRKNPAINKPDQRYRIMNALSGIPYFMEKSELDDYAESENIKEKPQEPTWIDENGILTVEYYSKKSESSMMAPYLIKCKLVVDSEQQYTIHCEQVVLHEAIEN